MYIDETDLLDSIQSDVESENEKLIGRVEIEYKRYLEVFEYTLNKVKYVRITRKSNKKSKSINIHKKDIKKLIQLLNKVDDQL